MSLGPLGAVPGDGPGGWFVRRGMLKIALALALVLAATTIGSSPASAACPNEQFRTGQSAQLPDCRAYELVTPAKVNAFPEAGSGNHGLFTHVPVTSSGDEYLWTMFPAGLPGSGSSGYANQYQAKRTGAGWISQRMSPSAFQSQGSNPDGVSADQAYALFTVEGSRGGTLALCPPSCENPLWVRHPDGSFHLLGEGTVPTDPDGDGVENGFADDLTPTPYWLNPDGSHQIFLSFTQLVPGAPTGTAQIYDRLPTGLELVSTLPGEIPPTESSLFAGSSDDGSTTMFLYGGFNPAQEGDLYARIDDARTIEVASGDSSPVVPGGLSDDGSKAFFVQEGNIFRRDLGTEEESTVVDSGDATLVRISPDGSHAYFLSPTELVTGKGTTGEPNLYVWDGASIEFIATVSTEDLLRGSGNPFYGLAFWTPPDELENRVPSLNAWGSANTSRTTPDGKIFVFESRAQLTAYPNEGHIEIYRFDTETEGLVCISCSPTEATATADSELVSIEIGSALPTVYAMTWIPNLSTDGKRIVFETRGALLSRDLNGVRDVYQWEEGDLALISTGHASQPSGLFGVTQDGSDIFIETGEKLVDQGQEEGSMAIYDARVGGGLPSQQIQQPDECVGDACQGEPSAAPQLPIPGSSTLDGKGNVKKSRCRHRRHKHGHRKAGSSKRRAHKRTCGHTRRASK
jgi:hypothetical protein